MEECERTMKRRRRGVVVDPSALSRKQARRKAEEKLKTVALQRDPERLNGSLNVSSPHPPSFQRFLPSLRGEEGRGYFYEVRVFLGWNKSGSR